MNTKKYIIWGTGWEAERFCYQYRGKIDILCFVDNHNYNKDFGGEN